MVSERSAHVEARDRVGHWEINTAAGTGSKDCIVSLVERRSGLLLIGKLGARTVESLNRRVKHLIRYRGAPFQTVTADNGTEFHGYLSIERRTGVAFYFAWPYHSWERGSNEKANGLIRQYPPEGSEHGGVEPAAVQLNRPQAQPAVAQAAGVQDAAGMLQPVLVSVALQT